METVQTQTGGVVNEKPMPLAMKVGLGALAAVVAVPMILTAISLLGAALWVLAAFIYGVPG